MKRKIAFFRIWDSPPIATSVEDMLSQSFPEYDIYTFNLSKIIKRNKIILIINTLFVFGHYGISIIRGDKRFSDMFWRTPYIFKSIKKISKKRISEVDFLFTFQLGSLYDASCEGIKHFVYTDHTHLENQNYPDFNQSQLAKQSWINLEKSIYQNASLVFTRSTNITRSLVEQYGICSKRVVCVYVGSNVEPNKNMLLKQKCFNKNILFVGIDWERKGGPDLLEAFRLVLESHKDASLTIIGANPSVDVANCEVIGKVPLERVGFYYQNATIFCLPTKREPFGSVFIEALAHKLPIIGTSIGAIPDFVEHGKNGYLINPGDIQSMANYIIDLLSNPQKCQSFGEHGYRMVQTRYNWKKVGTVIKGNIIPLV